MPRLPHWRRVAAYAVVVRDGKILLSQIAPHISNSGKWTLPGGGLEHGEEPRSGTMREVMEEAGLDVTLGEQARVYRLHQPNGYRDGHRVNAYSLRIVYDGWVSPDSPEPRVVEKNGSTVAAAWHDLADVRAGRVPVVDLVTEALADYRPFQVQRVGAYALIERGEKVLLARIGERGFHTGEWGLPGGGIDFGESPVEALVREVREETGLTVTPGPLLTTHEETFEGTAPSGRFEAYQAIRLIYRGTVAEAGEARLAEAGGTVDAVAWVLRADVESGRVKAHAAVLVALRAGRPAEGN